MSLGLRCKPGVENETGEMVHKFDPKSIIPTLGEGAPSSEIVMLEEQGRPGEYMPAYEDEHGYLYYELKRFTCSTICRATYPNGYT